MNCESIFTHAMNLIGATATEPDCNDYANRSLSILTGIFRELSPYSERMNGHKLTDAELDNLQLSDACPIDNRLSVSAGLMLASQLILTEDPESAAIFRECAEKALKNVLCLASTLETIREVYPL